MDWSFFCVQRWSYMVMFPELEGNSMCVRKGPDATLRICSDDYRQSLQRLVSIRMVAHFHLPVLARLIMSRSSARDSPRSLRPRSL